MWRSNREAKSRDGGPEVPALELFKLTGRTIIVTGGIGFMGIVTAETILEVGGDVICLDFHREADSNIWSKIEETATKFRGKAWYYSVNVTNADKVQETIEKAVSNIRYPIRGMVACAGISGETTAALDYPLELFRKIVDVNLNGAFICAQAVAREIVKEKHSASIVLVASMSAKNYNKGVDTAAYNSSKAGVLQLARSLAAEWGSRPEYPLIRVNTLSPGYIRTPMTEGALNHPTREAEWSSDNMLNRLSYVDEFRGPILYLLSDASSFMTGADMAVDGGHTSW